MPSPKTDDIYFKCLSVGKPIKKEVLLKKALESREYKKWELDKITKLHQWYKDKFYERTKN